MKYLTAIPSWVIDIFGRLLNCIPAIPPIREYVHFKHTPTNESIGMSVSVGGVKCTAAFEGFGLEIGLGRMGMLSFIVTKPTPPKRHLYLGAFVSEGLLCSGYVAGVYGRLFEYPIGTLLRGRLVEILHDHVGISVPNYGLGLHWYSSSYELGDYVPPEFRYTIVEHRDVYVWSRWYKTSTKVYSIEYESNGEVVSTGVVPNKLLTHQEMVDAVHNLRVKESLDGIGI